MKIYRCNWFLGGTESDTSFFYIVNVEDVFLYVSPRYPGYIYRWVRKELFNPQEIGELEFVVMMGQTAESVWERGKGLSEGQNNRRDGNQYGNNPPPV